MRRLSRALFLRCQGLFSVTLLSGLLGLQLLTGGSFQGATAEAVQGSTKAREYDFLSLKSVRTRIAELKAERKKEDREEEEDRTKEKDDDGLDYLGALEFRLGIRAFPEDTVDWAAIRAGAEQRDQMAANARQIFGPRAPGNWEFMGPTNCFPPYTWGFGPGQFNGRIASAAFHPTDPLTMYVATAGGGVWKTVDGGVHWLPLGDDWGTLPTNCVAVDPSNGNNVFVGTGDWDGFGGYALGIMKSIDGGQNWTRVGQGQFGNNCVRRILVDPSNGNIVTAVTGRGPGGLGRVWRSTDGGNTWNQAIANTAYWSDIVCSAPDPLGNRYYYAVASGTNTGVWISSNQGATWSQLTTPMRTGVSSNDTADLATSPTNPNTVYLLGTGNRKVWKSTNAGASWTDVTGAAVTSASWGQAWYDFYLTCSTNGVSDVLYVGLIDILQSPDGGATWRTFLYGYDGTLDKAHVDQHDLVIDPNNPNHALSCNDGGVYSVFYNPAGNTWTFNSLNANLGITQFYKADYHPTDSTYMLGGAQDNGTPASTGDIANWNSISGGDGTAVLINQTSPLTQYSTYQYMGGSSTGGGVGFNRTRNAWQSSSWIQTNVGSDRVPWAPAVVMDPNNNNVIYFGTNYLWKLTDGSSAVFAPRLGNQVLASTGTVLSIAVAKQNSQVIYTGASNGQVFVTRNAGTSFTQINTGSPSLPARAITDIKPLNTDANDVLVAVSGTGSGHLFRCVNTSAGTRVWSDVSGSGLTGLPNVPANAVERDPVDPGNTWYVGTDVGMFRTRNAGSTWENITTPFGLPNVEISTVTARGPWLYVSTYGRGIWRLNISPNTVSLIGLSVDINPVVGPTPSQGTVTLSNPAPANGTTITLSSSNTSVASPPATVTVPQGATSATFVISTSAVPVQTTVDIGATLGNDSFTAPLTVNANGLTSISFNPVQILGGSPTQGQVSVGVPAPPGGTTVTLTSLNTSVATVPASVVIPQGQRTANFTVNTTPVGVDTNVTIRATAGTTQVEGQITVKAADLLNFTLANNVVPGGTTVQGTITLNGRAPSTGAVITLTSSDTSIASVPATVTVPGNATSVNVTITAHPVPLDTGVSITASYRGLQRIANLTVQAQRLGTFTATPNPAVGGNPVAGRITLLGPANGNVVISLTTNNPNVATMPTNVTIPNGQSFVNFTITTRTVTVPTVVHLTAYYGTQALECDLAVTPLTLAGFTITPTNAFERATITGLVTLNGPALAGGAVVIISNTNSLAASPPTSVTIPQGQTSKSFTFPAKSVTSIQFTTISATRGNLSIPQNLTVSPITLDSVSVTPSAATGGLVVNGLVRLVGPAPSGGVVVTLQSSNTAAATVPTTVTIPAGSQTATFKATTKPVSGTTFVTISAIRGNRTVTTTLQVLPPEVKTFTISPNTTRGGNRVNATVTLTGKAPAGGIAVTIQANPSLAYPVSTVRVPQGATSVTFQLQTSTVSTRTTVIVSARTLNIAKTATLTLTP